MAHIFILWIFAVLVNTAEVKCRSGIKTKKLIPLWLNISSNVLDVNKRGTVIMAHWSLCHWWFERNKSWLWLDINICRWCPRKYKEYIKLGRLVERLDLWEKVYACLTVFKRKNVGIKKKLKYIWILQYIPQNWW